MQADSPTAPSVISVSLTGSRSPAPPRPATCGRVPRFLYRQLPYLDHIIFKIVPKMFEISIAISDNEYSCDASGSLKLVVFMC